jgi:hypothetical protein
VLTGIRRAPTLGHGRSVAEESRQLGACPRKRDMALTLRPTGLSSWIAPPALGGGGRSRVRG